MLTLKSFDGIVVADRIDLELRACRVLGLIGSNGAGKTTLLRCVVGAVPPASGAVSPEGSPIAPGDVPGTIRRGIAFVPQGHNVFPNLSVERNLHIAGLLFDGGFIKEVMMLFAVLAERRVQRAGSMSGDEQQMLALMTQPKWLLLDVPSTGLAPVIVRNVMAQLRKVNEAFGIGFVIVEQNVPVTLKTVDRALILKSGRVVFDGSSNELASHPDMWA
ncbi:MAG: ATP-binding cassette domain-containing protein [Bradyrhizobium sp.]|uniref:ABC transporter ATP-binding protein n=1 Tax=Bradyrhizobium sp. TaxID=376 RepID=UPI001D8D3CE4|nr:ATP-binding cassette domain-containing protein [Bradyrhizobium sp.]MBV9561884.1 ATP-binding cassette domain-containing protein [Bradyrhizobium sp.]